MQKPSLAGKVTKLTVFYIGPEAVREVLAHSNALSKSNHGYRLMDLMVLNLLPNLQHLRVNTMSGLPPPLYTQLRDMQYREANPALFPS